MAGLFNDRANLVPPFAGGGQYAPRPKRKKSWRETAEYYAGPHLAGIIPGMGAAQFGAEALPGAGMRDSMMLGQQAADNWRQGNYIAAAGDTMSGMGMAATEMIPGGHAAVTAGKGMMAALPAMVNWHGGPNKWLPEPGFPHGRPRLDKIGTGEGAQAYGHGFYSADAPGVAADYQSKLSDLVFKKPNGEIYDPSSLEHMNVRAGLRKHEGDIDAMMKEHAERGIPGAGSSPETANMYNRDMAVLSDIQAQGGLQKEAGALYKLDLPDADTAKYLDWDAPLSEQPEGVRAAVFGALTNGGIDKTLANYIVDNKTGMDAYSTISRGKYDPRLSVSQEGSPAASEALRAAGIPGLKYFDGMSRSDTNFTVSLTRKSDGVMVAQKAAKTRAEADAIAKEYGDKGMATSVEDTGTRNYVTWDQDVLDRAKLLERDGSKLFEGMD